LALQPLLHGRECCTLTGKDLQPTAAAEMRFLRPATGYRRIETGRYEAVRQELIGAVALYANFNYGNLK
jgi:hypothetical protein